MDDAYIQPTWNSIRSWTSDGFSPPITSYLEYKNDLSSRGGRVYVKVHERAPSFKIAYRESILQDSSSSYSSSLQTKLPSIDTTLIIHHANH